MDFKKAAEVAVRNAKDLIPQAKGFTLEGAVVSGQHYEITLSYYLSGQNPLDLEPEENERSGLYKLATLMGTRKEYKVFIIDKDTFTFQGFKNYKEG